MARLSRTGKPLCSRCRRLATHMGNYYRVNGRVPSYLWYCNQHKPVDAMPCPATQAAIAAIGVKQATPRKLQALLASQGHTVILEACQDALWHEEPATFTWSKLGIYVSAEEERLERRPVGDQFQASMDALWRNQGICQEDQSQPECPDGYFWNGRQCLRENPLTRLSLYEREAL